jgi:hypothetical protein
MIIDSLAQFCDTQVVCNSGSELCDYIIDLGAAKNIAQGKPLYLVIVIDTTFTTITSIDFQMMTYSTAVVTSGTIMCSTGAIAVASLTHGRKAIVLPIGDALDTAKQYIGLYCVQAGSNAGAGAITAFLTVDPPA